MVDWVHARVGVSGSCRNLATECAAVGYARRPQVRAELGRSPMRTLHAASDAVRAVLHVDVESEASAKTDLHSSRVAAKTRLSSRAQPLQKDVGYKNDEITTVYWFHYTPDALMVTTDSPFKTLKDFIDAAKKSPGSVTLSGSGTNSANHLAQQRFDKLAGLKTTYVPFSGTGPSNAALLGKQVGGSWAYTTVWMKLGAQVRCLGGDGARGALPAVRRTSQDPSALTNGSAVATPMRADTPRQTQRSPQTAGRSNRERTWRRRCTAGCRPGCSGET